ncbi:MAG: aminotransferase class V-fold PLP-dependent enzyme [Oscillospiraceae bacterium]|jgi:cysteine desulfurase|nr:aminotransferase class V-fold PLP-dependent enzyme [Oscillospiraceae bacterium]
MIYLDNAATTKPSPAVLAALCASADTFWANPSSLHSQGIAAAQAFDDAVADISRRFFSNERFVLTSGATEANNLALLSLLSSSKRGEIVATTAEHKSISEPLKVLESKGFDVIRVKPNEDLSTRVTDKTFLVTTLAVNNETGYITDTKRLYNAVKRANRNTRVHIDGVQAFLKTPLYGDTVSVSAHKVHGLKGTGGLFIRQGVRQPPIIYGGGQQGGIRPGTLSAESALAFAAAIADYHYNGAHFTELSNLFLKLLSDEADVYIVSCERKGGGFGEFAGNNFNRENFASHIIALGIKGIPGEVVTNFLSQHGVMASPGSACGGSKSSGVFSSFVGETRGGEAFRVSFSKHTTQEDIITAADLIKQAAREIHRY